MMRRGISAIAWILAMCFSAGQARAAVIIDQVSLAPTMYGNARVVSLAGVIPSGTYAGYRVSTVQTITAGQNGRLDHVDFSVLHFFGYGNLVMSLIDGDYAAGARTIIGQSVLSFQSLPYSAAPNILNQTFQTTGFNHQVTNGQKFSLLLDTTQDTTGFVAFGVGYADIDPSTMLPTNSYLPNYSGGKAISPSNISNPPTPLFDSDINFITYVDTAAGVPEPATWALLIVGFGIVGGALRIRRTTIHPPVRFLH